MEGKRCQKYIWNGGGPIRRLEESEHVEANSAAADGVNFFIGQKRGSGREGRELDIDVAGVNCMNGCNRYTVKCLCIACHLVVVYVPYCFAGCCCRQIRIDLCVIDRADVDIHIFTGHNLSGENHFLNLGIECGRRRRCMMDGDHWAELLIYILLGGRGGRDVG